MGNKNRFKNKPSSSYLRKSQSLELKNQGLVKKEFIVFGFKDIDKSQGEDYAEWELRKLLSKMLDRFSGLCRMTLQEAVTSQIIKIYGKGLPQASAFKIPNHLPDDTEWVSIRIQGKERIIGYIEKGFIFQVVFLDKEHLFYPSKKKKT